MCFKKKPSISSTIVVDKGNGKEEEQITDNKQIDTSSELPKAVVLEGRAQSLSAPSPVELPRSVESKSEKRSKDPHWPHQRATHQSIPQTVVTPP